jgi:hypothetical protein
MAKFKWFVEIEEEGKWLHRARKLMHVFSEQWLQKILCYVETNGI